jgi:uncharacterized protein YjdB
VTAVGAGSATITATAADGSGKSGSYTVTVSGTGAGIAVEFTGIGDETIDLTTTASSLSISNNGSVTITVPSSYGSYEWYVDGNLYWTDGYEQTIGYWYVSSWVGVHTVTVVVVKDGVPYSKELKFNVTL